MARRTIALAAAALCLGTTAATAHDVQTYSKTGYWASAAGTNEAGYEQCVTEAWGTVDNSIGMFLLVYDASHPSDLGIHISKQNWRIPRGIQVEVRLQIDSVSRVYNAYAGDHNDLWIELPVSQTDTVTGESVWVFLSNLMSNGRTMTISFPDGTEGPWTAPLQGSAAEIQNLTFCMKKVYASVTTQPTRPSTPTQPYQQPVTEPFGRGQ